MAIGGLSMSIIVQKYGGTSLRSIYTKNDVLNHIKDCISSGNDLVIVVSAIGRNGEPYATDTLINQLEKISNQIDPKKKDMIMSCGETISASIIAHLLDTEGIPSEALMGIQAGIVTDNNFSSSKILDIDTTIIKKHMKNGKVVVVAGFQGGTKEHQITTLGRGGSDITAVTLGGYLNAERVDIFTDVPGVAVVDPNIVPDAIFIRNISYKEMYKLANNGVGVIHPSAILTGEKFNVPINIRSTFSDEPGTLISSIDNEDSSITGIAIKTNDLLGEISLFLKSNNFEHIIKELEIDLMNEKGFIETIFSDDKVVFTVDPLSISKCTKIIYKYLLENNLIKETLSS